jgi:hypothetical protein
MWQLIVTAALYVFGIAFFRIIGGVAAAGEAVRRWGASEAWRRRRYVDAFQRSMRER